MIFSNPGFLAAPVSNFSDFLAVICQVANVHFYLCNIGASPMCGANEFYWSLAVEEQFYVIFPFLIFWLPRRYLVCLLAIVALSQVFVFGRHTWHFSGMIRTDGLAIGVLIALGQKSAIGDLLDPRFIAARWQAWLWFVACAVLLAVANSALSVAPFGLGLAVIVGGIWVWSAAYGRGIIDGPLRVVGAGLAYVGSRSYALYLVHTAAFAIVRQILTAIYQASRWDDSSFLQISLVGCAAALILSEMSCRFIETPLRKRGIAMAREYRAAAQASSASGREPTEVVTPMTSRDSPFRRSVVVAAQAGDA